MRAQLGVNAVTKMVLRELRTPLATIFASTVHLGRLHQSASTDLARTLERIERNVHRCTAILDDLLDYARAPALACEAVALDGGLDTELSNWTLPATVVLTRALNADITLTWIVDVSRRPSKIYPTTQSRPCARITAINREAS